MDFEKLVDLVVAEVYKRLENRNEEVFNEKKKLVVLWEDSLEGYKEELTKEYEIYPYEDGIKDCDTVVVSKLCLRGLANLANGMNVSNEERFILKMIMKGKKIFVVNSGVEYKRYSKTAPKILYNKYVEFEEKLKDYGVKFIDSLIEIKQCKDVVKNNVVKEEVSEKCESYSKKSLELRNKKLIVESDLRRLYKRDMEEVIIDKKSIITPLASDFIRIQKLNIKRV
ncbi:TIGR02536 family ethanolamine utilization protein [uncultured Clostridium sp.]|uniref:TIGR02536 family ethanolamine utilization protein n=1 Tax=uncultured Clostridium sp. TaxID=59620 RepID=UPI0028E98A6B|nr:TIGR02536 family ethanolamine utilization protein [uncultured Clostridium sp.]